MDKMYFLDYMFWGIKDNNIFFRSDFFDQQVAFDFSRLWNTIN
jgi:hypothetical protein